MSKHVFDMALYEALPNADYIKGILDRCTADGSVVKRYTVRVKAGNSSGRILIKVWTKKVRGEE